MKEERKRKIEVRFVSNDIRATEDVWEKLREVLEKLSREYRIKDWGITLR